MRWKPLYDHAVGLSVRENTHETPVFFHEILKINAQKIKLDAFGALKTIFEASLYPWLKAQKKISPKIPIPRYFLDDYPSCRKHKSII